jgi:cystathionine gamma-lyase
MNPEDVIAHYGEEYDRYLGAVSPPIFQTSIFNMNHGYVYTRHGNPTTEIVEKKIAALEQAEAAACFSTGMAALSAAISYCMTKNSHAILVKHAYGGAHLFLKDYMAKYGVETTEVVGERIEEFEQAVRPNTKMIYLESPSSFIYGMQDLQAVAQLAKSRGIMTVIDNTWATPLYQNPLVFGIDLVVHSASKYLGGHSDLIGGVIAGRKDIIDAIVQRERNYYGAVMDPHQAWLLLRGMRTLPLRMRQHQENAIKVAQFLEQHPLVERVYYPGLPSHPQYELGRKQLSGTNGLVSFVTKGSASQVERFAKSLKVFLFGASWGGYESLISTPGLNEQLCENYGIPRGLIRLSVGLERADTLIRDLDEQLTRCLR